MIDLDLTIIQWAGLAIIGLFGLHLLIDIIRQLFQLRLDRHWQKISHQQLKLAESTILQSHKDFEHSWRGLRKFRIDSKIKECNDVYSFYLAPHDRQPIPSYKPGQHLTVTLKPHNQKKIIRCYSLSDSPGTENLYVMTVKKLTNPDGKASGILHSDYNIGDLVELKAPKGGFFLNEKSRKPVILIANGVGITPLLAMLNFLYEKQPERDVMLFYGVRNGQHFIKEKVIRSLKEKHPLFTFYITYSQPLPDEQLGQDYDHKGYVNSEYVIKTICDHYNFQDLIALSEFEYYICGTAEMMSEMLKGLKAWQVPDENVNYEAFGAASIQKSDNKTSVTDDNITIEFKRSNKQLKWGHQDSLLELCQESNLPIDCGCCCGECGTCEVAILSGEVDYPNRKPETDVQEGHCLMCIAVPKKSLVLDA